MQSTRKKKLKRRLFGKKSMMPCCFCKKLLSFDNATLEHIVPKSKGGELTIENLKISCAKCNNTRGNMNYTEFEQGLRKRQAKMSVKDKLKKKFPCTMTLGFETEELKDAFIGQFLDGWGEGAEISCDWDWEDCKRKASDTDFFAVKTFMGDGKEGEE